MNFDTDCYVCGGTVRVEHGKVQPHRCRIDLDAQRAQPAPSLDAITAALPERRRSR